MKVIFTHGYFLNEDPREMEIMRPYVPLGLLYVSAYLEEKGWPNSVYDSTFSSFAELKNYLQNQQPDVVAIYTNLMTKLNVLKIMEFVRGEPQLKGCKLVLGGPEIRNHSLKFLQQGADFLVIGEGEQTMLELVAALANPKTELEDLQKISGLAWLGNSGEEINTGERSLLRDLNSLPLPARDKIDFKPYLDAWKKHHGYSMMSVSTMRGCPYTCKWCSRAVYGGTYRRRAPALVARELKLLKEKWGPDMIWFVDDVFTIHHKWLNEFAEEVRKQNAIIPYEIISRADRLNAEVLKTLKASGCFRIWIGAESGSQKIIDAMDRRVDVLKTREMIRLAQQMGIEAGTFIMLGYPGETKSDIRETITHLVQSNPSQFTITVAYPIKGTSLYNEVELSLNIPELDWTKSTDRDLDFKRTHPKVYYQHAVKWVMNEVYLHTKNPRWWKVPVFKLKSLYYQSRMLAADYGRKSRFTLKS